MCKVKWLIKVTQELREENRTQPISLMSTAPGADTALPSPGAVHCNSTQGLCRKVFRMKEKRPALVGLSATPSPAAGSLQGPGQGLQILLPLLTHLQNGNKKHAFLSWAHIRA